MDCDTCRPKSGADVFRAGLENEWESLKRTLRQLPPWFRLSQFLIALGAGERLGRILKWRKDKNCKYAQRLQDGVRRKQSKSEDAVEPELLEAFAFLWLEVLDPVDRALLEEFAGLNDDE